MLAWLSKGRDQERDCGFSMIELLVVIIIIGILAAIAIPVFLQQRKKGYVGADKSELNSISTAEEAYATDNYGIYTTQLTDLKSEGYNVSTPFAGTGGVTLTTNAAASVWCAQVQNSSDTSVTYAQSSKSGVAASGTCSNGVFTAATS